MAMKRGQLALYVVRTVTRPVFPEYEKTLAQDWDRTQADLYVFLHGATRMTIRNSAIQGMPVPYFISDKTWDPSAGVYTIARATAECFTHAMDNGYEYVGLLDDDAYFKEPKETIAFFLDHLRKNPRVGIVGPLGGLMVFFKFGKNSRGPYKDVIEIKGSPWATGGCQIYRTKALEECELIPTLRKLHRITDAYIYTQAFVRGWEIKAFNVPFVHRSSYLKTGDAKTPNWKMLLEQAHHDYPILLGQLPVEHCPETHRSVERIYRNYVRRYVRNLEAERLGKKTDRHQTWTRKRK